MPYQSHPPSRYLPWSLSNPPWSAKFVLCDFAEFLTPMQHTCYPVFSLCFLLVSMYYYSKYRFSSGLKQFNFDFPNQDDFELW